MPGSTTNTDTSAGAEDVTIQPPKPNAKPKVLSGICIDKCLVDDMVLNGQEHTQLQRGMLGNAEQLP